MKQKIDEIREEKLEEIKENEEKLFNKKNIITILLVFLSAFLLFSFYWLYANTGNVTVEQLLFHLKVPIKGTNTDMIWDYIFWTFLRVLIVAALTTILVFISKEIKVLKKYKVEKILYILSKIAIVASIVSVLITTNLFGFIKNQITASTFIEEEYVDPATAKVTFPEQKRNLIYIYLESMENTFSSKENGGIYDKDRIPELTQIAKENISFSNTEKLGGAVDLKGSHWTIAAMVSHTSGVPLKISIGENDYGNHSSFLPGAYGIGEILEDNGYKNYLCIGSDAEFGGRKPYFESHGNYEIWDYVSAIEEKRMSEFDKVWWGYSDNDLFKYAKEQLTEISQQDEPFNYTMLTVDTHFTDGYVCEDCGKEFQDRYSNVLRCSSSKISEFINWIKEQSFYENTTIVVTGDHLTMQASIEEETAKIGYDERTVYNAFINAKVEETVDTRNREFFTIDMYPTTLAALGATIEGDRLGLGTNLFSNKKTLAEEYGVSYVRTEIEKKSTFYNSKLIGM